MEEYLKQQPHPSIQDPLVNALFATIKTQLTLGYTPTDPKLGGRFWCAVFSTIIEARVAHLRSSQFGTVYLQRSAAPYVPPYQPSLDTGHGEAEAREKALGLTQHSFDSLGESNGHPMSIDIEQPETMLPIALSMEDSS